MKKCLPLLVFLLLSGLFCACAQPTDSAVPTDNHFSEQKAEKETRSAETDLSPVRHTYNIDHNAFDATQRADARKDTALDTAILDAALERKQSILSSITDIKVQGTAYYVSSEGNDSASGRSPETPWRTISKLNQTKLHSGDAVFFRRGDTWRGVCLELKAGVTYSAYGDGPKPAIFGSPENGAGGEKWSLLEGTDNIWVFCHNVLECGTLVLNETQWAAKVNPFIRDGQILMPDSSGRPFDVCEALESDLSFYCEDDTFIVYPNAFAGPRHPGKLYFRCDAGNPGDVYTTIEFCPWTNTEGGKGLLYVRDPGEVGRITDLITVDNLSLKYTGGYGIYLCGTAATVQNCEIGWIGGCTTNYFDSDFFGGSGNCVGNYGDVENYTVRDCYLYQAYDTGISSEQSYDGTGCQKNITFERNLIEDCLFGIEFFVSDESGRSVTLENVSVKDNFILNSGNGFGSLRQLRRWNRQDASLMFHPYYADMINVSVSDNVFYKSGNYLILCGSESKPCFSGNTYIQNNMGGLCLWGTGQGAERGLDEYLFSEAAQSIVRDIIGDGSATVPPLSR